MQGLAMVDGRLGLLADAVIPVTDPGFLLGWTAFDTFPASPGALGRVGEHLGRLRASAEALRVPWPGERLLADEVAVAVEALGGPARVRVTLTAGGRRVITVTPQDLSRWGAPVRAVRGPHRDEPFLGGRPKHSSRAPWAVAVARSGVDEVLLVDEAGRFTEGTTCGVLAVIGGVLWTAPDDGRILPSTSVLEILRRADALGVVVRREGPPAAGPWDALYVASATRDLAPVVELDGVALPGWDPVGQRLAARRT